MTKVICTATMSTISVLREVADVIRVNSAFGTELEIRELIQAARPCPLLLDIPGARPKKRTSSITDEMVIAIGKELRVPLLGLSYVMEPADIERARAQINDAPIELIAKIETAEVLEHLDAVIRLSDGVMIDRGDLGAAIGFEKLPRFQEKIIRKCNQAGKPVIVATELLRSMVHHTDPTKAEILDVANAVADGADYLLLSEETAIGNHPGRVVEVVRSIIGEVERRRKVLILAAGAAPQLGALGVGRPACLVDIGGTTILEHQLDNLRSCGVHDEDIIIAVGIGEKEVRRVVDSTDVQFVYNPWYKHTQMLTTVWLARERLIGEFVVLYGDVVFEPAVLQQLLMTEGDFVLAVDEKQCDEEDEKLCIREGRMILPEGYFDLPHPRHKCLPVGQASAEFIGMSKFSRWGGSLLLNETDVLMRENRYDAYLFQAFESLVQRGVDLCAVSVTGRLWSDNDTLDDVRHTKSSVYPKIRVQQAMHVRRP